MHSDSIDHEHALAIRSFLSQSSSASDGQCASGSLVSNSMMMRMMMTRNVICSLIQSCKKLMILCVIINLSEFFSGTAMSRLLAFSQRIITLRHVTD